MAIYSFYIFDRHTECIYTKSWLPPPRPESLPPSSTASSAPRPPSVVLPSGETSHAPPIPPKASQAALQRNKDKDDAKLIFGTVFSLRNMVRKLGGDDDAFVSFRTAEYKLHYYETPSNLKLVMLTDTGAMSMRNVLHQIYINLWVEYVVKNPLSPVEHRGGEGVKNELFELGLDQFVRGIA